MARKHTQVMTQDFLKAWGIRQRLSSTYYLHSNTRAVLKRMLRENTRPLGHLDTDKFASAMLNYKNAPLQGVMLSPAQIMFGTI